PAVLAAYAGRDVGKLQTVRHVMTRLKADGQLDQSWTIDAATDLVVALLSAAVSAELVEQKGWTLVELRERLLLTFRRTLLVSETHH
ncbi:MAG: hypothetical protein ACXV98_16095, partial [Ilumatobacteraceae bacterium]